MVWKEVRSLGIRSFFGSGHEIHEGRTAIGTSISCHFVADFVHTFVIVHDIEVEFSAQECVHRLSTNET